MQPVGANPCVRPGLAILYLERANTTSLRSAGQTHGSAPTLLTPYSRQLIHFQIQRYLQKTLISLFVCEHYS